MPLLVALVVALGIVASAIPGAILVERERKALRAEVQRNVAAGVADWHRRNRFTCAACNTVCRECRTA